MTCQNVTIAQAVKEFPQFAAYYLYYAPADKTGLKGGWDFSLNWSSGDHMPEFQAMQESQKGIRHRIRMVLSRFTTR